MSEELNDGRLQLEWLIISALRENLTLVNKGEIQSYNDTIHFAKESFKEFFDDARSPFGKKRTVSREYEKYEQLAEATSKSTKKIVTAKELIQEDIKRLETLVGLPENKDTEVNQIKKEIRRLKNLLRENVSKVWKITENQALRNDFRFDRPELEYLDSIGGKANIYTTSKGQQFTIRFLHPDKAETATGVDLLYEVIDKEAAKARIIAIQYKLLQSGDVLYFSMSDNLSSQLDRVKSCFCGKGLCDAGSMGSHQTYRLPFCTPFLRPTSKVISTEHLLTSGWHIPVCEVNNYLELGSFYPLLRLDSIKKVALNTEEFEKLFIQEKIGSRWLEYDELEDFYKDTSVLNKEDNIVIVSQSLLQENFNSR